MGSHNERPAFTYADAFQETVKTKDPPPSDMGSGGSNGSSVGSGESNGSSVAYYGLGSWLSLILGLN